MRCSSCDFENAEVRKFCMHCGSPIKLHCPKCGSENLPEASFCGDCGAALSEVSRQGTEIRTAIGHSELSQASEGERRHLTLLFSDLVGSTEIASHLDPERWREIVADFHHAAAAVIERYGGSVALYLGDGVMAYFGWPEGHDKDAEGHQRFK